METTRSCMDSTRDSLILGWWYVFFGLICSYVLLLWLIGFTFSSQELSQLADVINKIKNNPHDQKIKLPTCNPLDFKLSVSPCQTFAQVSTLFVCSHVKTCYTSIVNQNNVLGDISGKWFGFWLFLLVLCGEWWTFLSNLPELSRSECRDSFQYWCILSLDMHHCSCLRYVTF